MPLEQQVLDQIISKLNEIDFDINCNICGTRRKITDDLVKMQSLTIPSDQDFQYMMVSIYCPGCGHTTFFDAEYMLDL